MNDPLSTLPSAPQPAEQLPTGPHLQLLIDAFLADLEAVHLRETRQLTEQLRAAWRLADLRLGATREELAQSRQILQRAFSAPGSRAKPTPAECADLTSAVAAELARLFGLVRPETDRKLRELSPRNKVLPDFFERLHAGYRLASQGLPDLSTPPSPAPPTAPAGSLWDQAGARIQHRVAELRHAAEQNLHLTPRRLVEDLLDQLPEPAVHPLNQRYQQVYAALLEDVADCWRALRFEMEAALEELRQTTDSTRWTAETAAGIAAHLQLQNERLDQALADSDSRMAKALVPVTVFLEGVEIDLKLDHRDVVNQLQHALAEVDSWDSLSHHTVRRSARRIRQLLAEGETLVTQGRQELARWHEPFMTRQTSGSGVRERVNLLTLVDLPTTDAILSAASQLPPLYQRLFLLGPLKNREFLTHRETPLEELQDAIARWEAGRAASVALIGPPGSGKRSLLNCFANEIAHREAILRLVPTHRLTSTGNLLAWLAAALQLTPPPASLQQLIADWLAGPRRIVACEELQRLSLRTINGTEAAQALLRLIVATQRHTLWIVTCETYPWQRLDYLLETGRCFTHQIDTAMDQATTLREAIMLRHRTAGTALTFTPHKGDSGGAMVPDSESRYFARLSAISGGHLDAAIHWWLHSLTYHPGEQRMTVAELPDLQPQMLGLLHQRQLLALAEIISHGGLTLDEYCLIFREKPDPAQLFIDTLCQLNLLARTTNDGDRYTINPLMAETVAQTLRTLNLLY